MGERLTVEARGRNVVFELDGRSATYTPREAQSFAFQLARAYMRAGGTERSRAGNIRLKPEGAGR
jgi:hypothetical protein